jgi:peptide deformylase
MAIKDILLLGNPGLYRVSEPVLRDELEGLRGVVSHPAVFINPVLDLKSDEMIELWDDCMSFPELLVRVKRHRSCRVTYRDDSWEEQQMSLEEDMAELLQHEVDHLDGILAVQRAIDPRSFALARAMGRG